MSEAARWRRDEARYEPQMAAPAREAASSDPLAELARLVGQDDPFRNVFRSTAAPARPGQTSPDEAETYAEHRLDEAGQGEGGHDAASYPDEYRHDGTAHAEDADHADGHVGPGDHHDAAVHHYAEDDDAYYAAAQAAHPDEAGMADERLAPGYEAGVLPDAWARGDVSPALDRAPAGLADAGMGQRSAARRPVAVLAAVLLLTGGGLAATFLAKGPAAPGAAAVSTGRGAPTIMAATGPTKVKIDDGSATAPEDQDAALLNKNGSVSSGPVKIVSSQEQPADLAQLPKADLADGAHPLPPPAANPFPEPKKVKTFLVHPDGTVLSGGGALAPSGQAATPAPAPATGDDAPAAAPLPATPRTAAQGNTTPKSAPPPVSIATLAMDPAFADTPPAAPTRVKPPRQAASPGVHTASAKPNDTADAPGAAGGFGVQLASSPNEADANAAFAKLKKKYPSQLASYSATVHRAETGDKPVYRVRIGGMSQDDAKSLCSQLVTAGGTCYVTHN